jgi:hypothetical protein
MFFLHFVFYKQNVHIHFFFGSKMYQSVLKLIFLIQKTKYNVRIFVFNEKYRMIRRKQISDHRCLEETTIGDIGDFFEIF